MFPAFDAVVRMLKGLIRSRSNNGRTIVVEQQVEKESAKLFTPLENLIRVYRVLLRQLRYRIVSYEALFGDLALDLDGPTPPSLTRSVHLSLVGTCLVPTITITYPTHFVQTVQTRRLRTSGVRDVSVIADNFRNSAPLSTSSDTPSDWRCPDDRSQIDHAHYDARSLWNP
jgi:hypothetical protein